MQVRLTAAYGSKFAVVSVFTRTGDPGLLPDAVGAEDLRRWLATQDPVNRYGRYREGVIAALRLSPRHGLQTRPGGAGRPRISRPNQPDDPITSHSR